MRGRRSRAASLAAAWAGGFAAVSAYWAAGGMLGASTLAVALTEQAEAREPGFVALLWFTAAGKAALAALAVALGRAQPARLLRWAANVAGAALLLYGTAGLVESLLFWSGALEIPAGVGAAAVPWYVLLWEPVWIAGGGAFLAAARAARY